MPSSNSYSLPKLLGTHVPVTKQSAACSMTGRSKVGGFAEDFAKTPGPGTYSTVKGNIYARNAPSYSMLGRSKIPGSSELDKHTGSFINLE